MSDRRRKGETIAERFFLHVEKTEGCWLWRGYVTKLGYGWFSKTRSKPVRAHRFAYELLRGPIPEGLTIDHLCRVRHCVNPDHMETVTGKVNTLRGYGPAALRARATHCLHGHELSGQNIAIKKGHGGRVYRSCRTCQRERSTRRRLAAS